MQFSIGKMIKGRHNSITLCPIDRPITIFVTCGRNCATLYSCVHNQIATFGLLGRQSVTLNIGCSHNRDNRLNVQSVKLYQKYLANQNIGGAKGQLLRGTCLSCPKSLHLWRWGIYEDRKREPADTLVRGILYFVTPAQTAHNTFLACYLISNLFR